MNIGLRLFLSSMVFGITIAVAYWICSRDYTGVILLGFMAFGLAFAAGYMIVAEREADLIGDSGTARQIDGAGDDMGVYTFRSPWPFWLAASIAAFLIGLTVAPVLAIGAAFALIAVCWELVRESR